MTLRTPPRRGFTLIELMIALAIVAILTAIALPSYQSYIQSARRTDGQASLQRIMLEQEKWRSNHPTYTATLSDLGVTSSSADGHYTLALSGTSGTGYTATATATGGQANDAACADMTLEVDAADVTTGPAGCWKQ
ncbi:MULTISPECIES: type IV pilin protein [unclassified Thiocapsa]|uniref:type IV pilin protein n=1 Tax=unclassified Thiocapsa TaxID=2641286 RepID=UPI0035ADE884